MPTAISLPSCLMDCYKALYPRLDFSRVAFYSGLPSLASLGGPDAFTMASGAASSDIRMYIKDYEPCGKAPLAKETFLLIAHELVHACLANMGSWPSWLHEGLAQYMSGRTPPPGAVEAIKALAKAGKLPKLMGLGQGWGNKSTAEAQLAYAMALEAVDLFFQYHAGMGIRNLLNNPSALPAITEDLDRRLHE